MNIEIIFKRIWIIIVLIIINIMWFILNMGLWVLIQYLLFRIIEVNEPIILGATLLTFYDMYRKINSGAIKQYFEESKW